MKINSVVFVHWSGDFDEGRDHNGYLCLPRRYYVYMPVRICTFSSYAARAGISYDIDSQPRRRGLLQGGVWPHIPIMHLDEVYDQTHFLTSLLLTPRKFWPSARQYQHIEDTRKDFNYHNRHIGKVEIPF